MSAINIGGNHLANVLIQMLGPDFAQVYPPGSTPERVRNALRGFKYAYDIWVCWSAIQMHQRSAQQ